MSPSKSALETHLVVRLMFCGLSRIQAMMPTIQDQIEIEGPNGTHSCIVTSPAQSSVATARSSRVFKIETARALVA